MSFFRVHGVLGSLFSVIVVIASLPSVEREGLGPLALALVVVARLPVFGREVLRFLRDLDTYSIERRNRDSTRP